ncbi:DUF4307 domain-containing protein [Rhodococcus sp. 06-156-3C]|uniref:DUF4307 domain-containing protein n=1 Tax=Nocardiaceae TaxID=85025 RepID=UPI000522EB04|nr:MULTISPECIES: DUF4307 domain-containing protein [Rhodococcus]OZD14172.1 DUF4307 domain-containing protein [Rhodococcus sp. 06-156-3C]OZD15863.1 DUF4307 domain-containing protein [Rhodococcus sp. 06-156-4C]OZD24508.1 DUF4307 domain-containing protein [Rhodococcus sp. 06-156-3b]OZD28462.1 DUF4307 domain-containing protein [Rhodococcus sp. 06-156-4a]OZD36788.1 DUF4307 domain-containing protein [Rhodococcus sp. 06-156-3]
MTATLPEGRYPASSSRRGVAPRTRNLLLVVAVLVGLVVAYLAYQRFAVQDVEGKALTFDLMDDETISISFSVTRADPEQEAVCIVRARSRDGSETGRREVFVPGSSNQEVQVTTVLRTSQPPAVGDVYGCSTNVPEYLRAG